MNVKLRRLVAACSVLFAVSPTCFAEPVERRLPQTLMSSSRRTSTEMFWRNGERAGGEPTSADSEVFRWKTALFKSPITLPHSAIRRVDFSGSSKGIEGTFRFVFEDGCHLTGELKSIEAGAVTLTSSTCGEVVVRLDQLAAIERISGSGIVAAGPARFLSGDSTAKGRFGESPAYISAAGEVVFLEFNGGLRDPIDLPDKCLVQLQLRIEREPAFSLDLSSKGRSVVLSTWGDELVLSIDDSFVSAGPVAVSEDGVLNIQIGWDRTAGACIVFDKLSNAIAELGKRVKEEEKPAKRPKKSFLGSLPLIGEQIQRMVGEEPPPVQQEKPKPEKGVTLTNRGAGFVVERYTVTEWSGKPPLGIQPAGDGVETAGEFITGKPIAYDGTNITVKSDGGEREIPLADVRSLRWLRPPEMGPALPQTQLWYSDGNLLRGTLLGIEDGEAQLKTSFADAPITASLGKSRALVFPLPTNKPKKKERPLEEMDTIAVGDLLLRGTIHPAGGTLPEFTAAGSEGSLPPLHNPELIIQKHLAEDSEYTRAKALLNTKSKEVLPVTVDRIADEKIHFHWDASQIKETATSNVDSIQFPEPVMNMEEGFGAAGWRILGKRKRAPGKAEKGAIALEPDMSLGHPNILQGSDFGFSVRKKGHNNVSFRIRLFCQGVRDKAKSTNFLIAHYGTIYAGLERGESGQFANNRSDFSAARDEAIRVDFKFRSNTVEMRINNQVAASSKIKTTSGAGTGLIIEPASLWGNTVGAMTVSGFSMRGSPLGVAAPTFNEDAKREALLLPRLRRDVPPRHILIGRNGDLLRGEIESKSDSHIKFRVGLETYKVPVERIGAAVWVKEADKTMNDVKKKPATKKKKVQKNAVKQAFDSLFSDSIEESNDKATKKVDARSKEAADHTQQWLDLTNGGHMKLDIEAWHPEHVIGTHEILGRCKIPTDIVHRVSLKKPVVGGALVSLSDWKFKHTIDPNPPGQEEVDVSPLVGKPAPDFTLKMLDGEEFKLSKAKGKVVVLDFWATWCAPCVRSLPHVIEAMAEFPDDKVAFITVNQGESKKQIEQFMDIRGFKMPVGFDPEMKTGENFGVESIPYTVVIDGKGTVTYVSLGASPDGAKKLSDAVAKALAAGDSE